MSESQKVSCLSLVKEISNNGNMPLITILMLKAPVHASSEKWSIRAFMFEILQIYIYTIHSTAFRQFVIAVFHNQARAIFFGVFFQN